MKKEVKVGLFAILMLLIGWGVIRVLKGADLFGNTNTYYVYYEQVGGLQEASQVMLYGVKVGSVTKVALNEDPTKGVQLTLEVDKRYMLPVDSKAKIFNNGLMGGKAVEIIFGNSSEILPDEGTLQSEQSIDLMEMASSEVEGLLEKVTVIMDNLTQTLEGINGLMAQNSESITSIVSNVDGVTGNVNAMLAKERVHLEQAIASLSEFSKSLGDNSEQIDSIIGNIDNFSTQLASSDLITEVEGVVSQLNAVLASANAEDGSVGKLLRDDELYDNLTQASDNLSLLLADLKENPHRYINVSVFGSDPYKKVEKAKAKAEKKEIKRAAEAAKKAEKEAEKGAKKAQ